MLQIVHRHHHFTERDKISLILYIFNYSPSSNLCSQIPLRLVSNVLVGQLEGTFLPKLHEQYLLRIKK